MQIPPNTHAGQVFRLRGKGFPQLNASWSRGYALTNSGGHPNKVEQRTDQVRFNS